MFNSLRRGFAAGLIAVGLFSAGAAQSLTLDCENKEDKPIAVAVSYLSSADHKWYVEGWYNLKAKERALIELPSSNNIFYIFGEFQSGHKVEGGPKSIQMPITWDSFKYTQAQPVQNPDSSVYFVRGAATNGYAQISFGPIRQ